MYGTLEFEDFLMLQSFIFRQTERKFRPDRMALKDKQYEIFLRADQLAFERHFQEAQVAYNTLVQKITEKACEFASFDINKYMMTKQFIMSNEETAAKLQERELLVRSQLDLELNPVTMDEKTAIQAVKFKI